MNRTLAALIASILALAPALPAAAAVKNPDTFVYATIGDPESFDPAWAYDTASHAVIDNVYEYLLAFDGAGVKPKDLSPRLATKVPTLANGLISKDGLTYRFPIRKGVKFHDGTPLTPDDVRYSLLRFMLFDRDGGPSSLLLEPILGSGSTRENGKPRDGVAEAAFKAVTVQGDDVVVRLAKPFAPFLTILPNFGAIMSRKWCAAHGQWDGEPATWRKYGNPPLEGAIPKDQMNGTGPFKLARFEANTKQTILARNDAYWRKPARLKNVVFKVIDEFATRKLMIEAGDADVVYVPQMYKPQVAGIPGVRIVDGLQDLERSMLVAFAFKINATANPYVGSGRLDGDGIPPDFFADKDVRQAFAFAIDYPSVVRDIERGTGAQSSGIIPRGLIGARRTPPRYRFDLGKAAEHMKKAWGGKAWEKGFKFTLVYNTGSAPLQPLCQMIKKNIESLNPKFRVDIRSIAWSTFLEQSTQRKIPVPLGAWQADYPDPHNFAYPILHTGGYFPTQQGYSNPKLDALIDKAVETLDERKREALYKRIQDMAEDEVSIIPVVDGPRYRVQRDWVKGYVFNPIFPDAPYNSDYYGVYKAD